MCLQGPRCRRQRRRTVSRARLGWGSQTQPAPTFGRGTRIITRSQSNSRITSPAARPVPRGPQGASKAAPRTSCLTWRPSRKTALCLWLTAGSRSCLSQEEVRPRCPGPRSWSVASPWLVHCPLTQSWICAHHGPIRACRAWCPSLTGRTWNRTSVPRSWTNSLT